MAHMVKCTVCGKKFDRDKIQAVKKQIKEFKKEYDYSYSGMLKTLIWWYEIKGNSKEKANGGIGIIPFVYKDALTYYYSLYLAQLANENVESIPKPKVKEIEIYSPEVHRRPPKMWKSPSPPWTPTGWRKWKSISFPKKTMKKRRMKNNGSQICRYSIYCTGNWWSIS